MLIVTQTCVATVLSAFHDAEAILERIKLKAAQNGVSPPPRELEACIYQAPEDIEKEKQRGIARFGDAFEDGDHTATIALQQIIIQLQSDLMRKLRDVAHNEENVDLNTLIDAADSGRDKTIAALLELKQRLLHGAERDPGRQSQSYQVRSSLGSQEYENSFPGSGGEPAARSTPFKARERASEEDSPYLRSLGFTNAAAGAEETRTSRRHRHSSILERFRHSRADSGLSGPTDTLFSFPRMSDSSDPSTASSLQVATRQLSTVRSRGSNSSASNDNLLPNPDNNYLGFCKGAARLQSGDRTALQKTKEFNDGWSSSTVYYLSCFNSKCAFSGHMDLNTIWTKVWDVSDDRGLKFRWSFLAKSHVCISKVKNQQYAYQCLFCVFLGDQPPVLHGTDLYLEHVSQEHRGQTLGDVVLHRTCCVNNRACDNNEPFDINLLPLGPEEARLRKQGDMVSDDLMNPRNSGSDAADSISATEPWNQGLSDFHYTDGYELCETLTLRSFRSHDTG